MNENKGFETSPEDPAGKPDSRPSQTKNENKAFEASPDDPAGKPVSRPSQTKNDENGFHKTADLEKAEISIEENEDSTERVVWGNQIEFLMSCIATSVGLGNVWRFPFVAYQNGGGAFLIPYIIVLFLVGKPMYYLECILGQFSSRNSVKVWAISPAMKGTGYAQSLGCTYILTYYVSIVAMCLFYLAMSFQAELPWAVCREEWDDVVCIPSTAGAINTTTEDSAEKPVSSAELYFTRRVLRQPDNIDNGIGTPLWDLTLCLFASWLIIFLIVARGVKSSGKAAYFLAIFPYIVMVILLIRAVTLEGSGNGILFFLTPQWEKLVQLEVWYAAVTQVFFSLSVCTGAIIMFSSYNGFRQNIYRDAMIVTTLDTFTSLLSGITIFGILGNLAFELGYEDVNDAIGGGGTGLAFISYPDAIAKSPFVPQLFAVLFFLMMVVLGIGSAVALLSTVNTVMLDSFPRVPTMAMSAMMCTVGFLIGLIYVCPGGQFILELVDYYGGTFLILFCAIAEIVGVLMIYGLESLCLDLEYMLGIKTSFYWRFCWGLITPVMMIAVFIYALASFEALLFAETIPYPTIATVFGYVLLFVGIALVPIVIFIKMYRDKTGNFSQTLRTIFNAKESWGPRSAIEKANWREFKTEAKQQQQARNYNLPQHCWAILTGRYRR